jgi:hypothetical protein
MKWLPIAALELTGGVHPGKPVELQISGAKRYRMVLPTRIDPRTAVGSINCHPIYIGSKIITPGIASKPTVSPSGPIRSYTGHNEILVPGMKPQICRLFAQSKAIEIWMFSVPQVYVPPR